MLWLNLTIIKYGTLLNFDLIISKFIFKRQIKQMLTSLLALQLSFCNSLAIFFVVRHSTSQATTDASLQHPPRCFRFRLRNSVEKRTKKKLENYK